MMYYLGYRVSNGELMIDPFKLEVMKNWLTSTFVTKLRGFLELSGYYRKFLTKFTLLAALLSNLLNKTNFK